MMVSGSAKRRDTVFHNRPLWWEISLKYALGKLELTGVKPKEMPDFTAHGSFCW